jgi:signal transduction histidine kinase
MIANRPSLANGFGKTEDYLEVAIGAVIVIALIYRLLGASTPSRRTLLPAYVPALLMAIPFVVFHAASSGLISLGARSTSTVGWVLTAGRTALTFGFALALWQAALYAGAALKMIMTRLGDREDAAHFREIVAGALDDPRLELAFEIKHGSRFFVDANGDQIDIGRPGADRSATPIQHQGQTVAYMLHDDALETDPELVQAAGQAVLLALETGRLESEVESKTAQLRRSSRRIVAAGEAERQRIERDLHDGAQQRLMAIHVKLALLRDRLDSPELASEVDKISEQAAVAVDELRDLAHGIYPSVLRDRGLADAVRSIASTAPVDVRLVDHGIGRCTPATEITVYFCLNEAIQNAAKHAGRRTRVTVTLERLGSEISFDVVDDGAGFDLDRTSDGIGLTGIRDRMTAIGGEVEITAAPGKGTRIQGTAPDNAPADPARRAVPGALRR